MDHPAAQGPAWQIRGRPVPTSHPQNDASPWFCLVQRPDANCSIQGPTHQFLSASPASSASSSDQRLLGAPQAACRAFIKTASSLTQYPAQLIPSRADSCLLNPLKGWAGQPHLAVLCGENRASGLGHRLVRVKGEKYPAQGEKGQCPSESPWAGNGSHRFTGLLWQRDLG